MSDSAAKGISLRSSQYATFLFFGLLIFSVAFFISAENRSSAQNIFLDSDQDGLSNEEEKLYGTDSFEKDTDGDGYSDGVEVESGYDPLKPAPGDKIVAVGGDNLSQDASEATEVDEDNITKLVSSEIANVLKNSEEGDELSLDQINESIQEMLSGQSAEIVLPEINVEDIKLKKAPSKKLSDEEYKKEERKDILEYLTVVSFILANHSPKQFQSQDELNLLFQAVASDSVSALSSGNLAILDSLSETGEKVIDELREVEVPEAMLEIHIKALKLSHFALQLKKDLKHQDDDPLGQILSLSQIQGFIAATLTFTNEIEEEFSKHGIDFIPLDI